MSSTRVDAGAGEPLYFPEHIRVIDSHTEGEPTRVVISGWPALHARDMAARRAELAHRWSHLRSAVVCEPRGHDAMVGALLVEPVTPGADAGVIFFNNAGCLGMCGHGLIGVVRTLAHLGRVRDGHQAARPRGPYGPDIAGVARGGGEMSSRQIIIDTPVGVVSAHVEPDGAVTIANVPARCHELDVSVSVPSVGMISGDIAWGGNWFFITKIARPPLELANAAELMQISREIAAALHARGITGADGAVIDHIELTADGGVAADGINFVLCPGGAYDRSPCGTGTSAKLAVMRARGELGAGDLWRQRSITGGVFTAWYEEHAGLLYPFIRGRAWITGEAELRFDDTDPLRGGFTSL